MAVYRSITKKKSIVSSIFFHTSRKTFIRKQSTPRTSVLWRKKPVPTYTPHRLPLQVLCGQSPRVSQQSLIKRYTEKNRPSWETAPRQYFRTRHAPGTRKCSGNAEIKLNWRGVCRSASSKRRTLFAAEISISRGVNKTSYYNATNFAYIIYVLNGFIEFEFAYTLVCVSINKLSI